MNAMNASILVYAGLLTVLTMVVAPAKSLSPIVIAHRGASGERPEHTLAAYRLGAEQGADYIEPDLVMTKDGVLVARHENALAVVDPESEQIIEATTDVADRPEFAALRTTKVIDGQSITGWFVEDMTLEQLQSLRAVERLPELRPASTHFDGRFAVPTFQQVLELADTLSSELGRPIGVYPELKHPGYFRSIGLPMEQALVDALDGFKQPVFIQSFEPSCLERLSLMTDRPLVALISSSGGPADESFASYGAMVQPESLARVAEYCDGVGVIASRVLGPSGATGLVEQAHEAGLDVHVWTIRQENRFLPERYRSTGKAAEPGDVARYVDALLECGVDGLFTDHPQAVVEAVGR